MNEARKRPSYTLSETKRKLLDQLLEKTTRGEGPELPPAARIEPRVTTGPSPLSFGQERLWFLDRLEPGSPYYNIPRAIRVRGVLRPEVLEQAFTEIVRRHEILRTTFSTDSNGSPVQIVAKAEPFVLPITDLSLLPVPRREQQAIEMANEDARTAFDLERGPLMRGRLLRLAGDDHVLLLNMHHIVSDGWSAGILVREVVALSEAFTAGQPSPLSEPRIQYADYAIAQREWLGDEALAGPLAFWKSTLAGAPPLLQLPSDRPRPAAQSHRGAHFALSVPAEIAGALGEISRQEGATLFMTLLAAFQTFLHRLTGRTDILVGTLVANRNRVEIEELIGFFANTLVLRTDLSGDPEFRQLVRRARGTTLAAFSGQELPFEKLVAELAPERDPSYHPLFQVMLLLQNAPAPEADLQGIDPSVIATETGTSRFDLAMTLEGGPEGLSGSVEYSTDLFDGQTVERWMEQWKTLLSGIAENPQARLSELPFLPPWQRRMVLETWTGTASPAQAARCAHELFEQQVERTPERDAVLFEKTRVSYRQLNESANRLARRLRELGVGAGSVVAIHMERSAALITAVLAILKAGGACLSLDPSWPTERLSFMLADSGAPLLLTEAGAECLSQASRVVRMDLEREAIARLDGTNLEPLAAPDDIAYLIYTSGSTGRPKGIAMPHRSLANLVEWHCADPARPRRILQFAALSFDVSFQEILSCLATGATLIPVPETTRLDPVALGRFLAAAEVERAHLPNAVLSRLAEEFQDDPRPLASLREILVGGEQLQITRSLRRLFEGLPGCALHNHYGPSESHVVTSLPLPADRAAWPTLPPIGRPIANTRTYVLDRALRPVPIGVAGELFIAGRCLARGYVNRPELTAERFLPDPYGGEPGGRMYRTGDLVRWRAEGTIEFLGRTDQQVKIRGMRIEPGEIETVLSLHPAVQEAVVLARQDGSEERHLVGYVVPRPGQAPPAAASLRAWLRETLPEYMVPSWFVTREAFPRTPNGKIDRLRLPPPDRAMDEPARAYTPPRTAAEEKLAAIWRETLGVERIGVDDRFFDLGGHSLLATQVLSRIRGAFGVEIPVGSFFEAPTIAGLAAIIDGNAVRGGGRPCAPPAAIPALRRGTGNLEALLGGMDVQAGSDSGEPAAAKKGNVGETEGRHSS